MLDVKLLRNSIDEVASSLERKGYEFNSVYWSDLEDQRKILQSDTESLQSKLNTLSKEIGELKRLNKDSSKIEKDT